MSVSKLFSFLSDFSPDELSGELISIYIAKQAGESMRRVDQAEAVKSRGLSGDRYASGSGHWHATDACDVTLVSAEELDAAERRVGQLLPEGWHRRNLVVKGIALAAVRRRNIRIGDALFAFHRLRPPCGYLDRISGAGSAKALGKAGGIGLKVLENGVIRVGDSVCLLDADSE